jgi:hypothetical protein
MTMSKRRADIGQTANEIVAERIVAFLNGSNFTGTIVFNCNSGQIRNIETHHKTRTDDLVEEYHNGNGKVDTAELLAKYL